MPKRQDDAERFLAEASRQNPERYSEVVEQYPTNSPDDNYRHAHGRRRVHRASGEVTTHVPKGQRRQFTDDEWAETQEAIRRGRAEWEEDYKYAKQLADEGM